MGTLTIRDVDDQLKAHLRVRAAAHGRSMEAEVRAILQSVLEIRDDRRQLGTRIHARFAHLGPVELPDRSDPVRVPEFPE